MFTEKMTRRPAEFAKLTDDERERKRARERCTGGESVRTRNLCLIIIR